MRLCEKSLRNAKLLKNILGVNSRFLSSKDVRQSFLDFFRSQDHEFIRSSPVRPFSDPTLEFVNAGMNQFKNVFLGLTSAPARRAVNSQKCIRVGGKHNDLDCVGYDTYHHTFFEMLGNWSFNDYFKEEACEMAWKLVTSPPYSLPKDRLYVTYFGGDQTLGLMPDLETKEVWKKLGVPENRILPFGTADNFWEMGMTGPCGPCTEIHYDHLGSKPRPEHVNAGLENLTELWNIVFIQYRRNEDTSLTPLKQFFVDTGMGFERLVALMQSKSSNYDTDLFTPLFKQIEKYTNKSYSGKFGLHEEKDTNYRILADHSRMITSSLSDNIFPDESHSLRRVIRKSFIASEKLCGKNSQNLLLDLTKVVGETLGHFYPETVEKRKQTEFVLKEEFELWKEVEGTVAEDWKRILKSNPALDKLSDVQSIGLIGAIKELDNFKEKTLNPSLALTLYERFGLNPQLIEEIAHIKGLNFDKNQLSHDINELKRTNKLALYSSELVLNSDFNSLGNFMPTDDIGRYTNEPIKAKILHITQKEDRIGVLLDKTNFWTSSKGDNDIGIILFENGDKILVDNLVRYGDFIFHFGTTSAKCDNLVGASVILKIDEKRRANLARNVTASHLLSRAIKTKLVPHIKLFVNTEHNLTIKYKFYGQVISEGEFMLFEFLVNKAIKDQKEIKSSFISSKNMFGSKINVPLIVSPESQHFPVVQFCGDESEISFGPNVKNTKDVGEFCITNIDINKKKHECIVKFLTGPNVSVAYDKTNELLNSLYTLNENSEINLINSAIAQAKHLAKNNLVPMSLRIELNHLVSNLNSVCKKKIAEDQMNEMKLIVEKCKGSREKIVHYVGENVELEKLTRLCPDLPVMLFAFNNGKISARCCSPKEGDIKASEWMSKVAQKLGSQHVLLKGHDPDQVSSLKPVKVHKQKLDEIISEVKKFALKSS